MKKNFMIGVFAIAICLMGGVVGCSQKANEQQVLSSEIDQLKSAFESMDFQSIEEASAYAKSLVQDLEPISKAYDDDEYDYLEYMSLEALEVIEAMRNVEVDTEDSPEALRIQLKEIIQNSTLSPTSTEYCNLMYSVDIAIEAIYYAMEIEAPEAITKGFWNTAWNVVKCVGGTAGSAGLGILAGAAVGTVTLPVVGTISGTALGGWSGALVGIATFC